MIAGLFLRSYKTYENYNFIPFTNGKEDKFHLFIGNNGAGKSSVLEALDTFFNDRAFIVHSNAKPENSSIAPVFLIQKDKLKPYTSSNPNFELFLQNLSYCLWNEDFNSLYASNPTIEEFTQFREEIKENFNSEDYYLFVLGNSPLTKETNIISLQNIIIKKFDESYSVKDSSVRRSLNMLGAIIKQHYRFIYIPVETSISEFLKLEDTGMQSLMDQDLKNEIVKILNHTFKSQGKGEVRQTQRDISIMNFVNEKLDEYVTNVENEIRKLETNYHFNKELRSKRVNAKDFADVIIDIYFKRRRLQKNQKEISHLSAGERKKALIDIAYTFLSQKKQTEREIVIAIDEPESSLNLSMCYDQFERIEEMANKFGKQLFVTTHWYGGLPILSNGRLYHVHKKERKERKDFSIGVEIFSLENYFEERGSFPDDVNLKSFFDLTSSIVSAIRTKETTWLIVEGISDKKYLEHYLPKDLDIKILPVGGCSIVKKLYEYLYLPINASEEAREFNGKVVCLIDTDMRSIQLSNMESETKNKKLIFRRLQIDDKNNVKLLRINDNLSTETEIEEVLFPNKFYNSLITVSQKHGYFIFKDSVEKITDILSNYQFNPYCKSAKIKGTDSIFKPLSLDRNFTKDMDSIYLFFDQFKDAICQEYISSEQVQTPLWVGDLTKLISKN